MILETIKTPGLAHFSYLFGDADGGRCVVIDPRRDIDCYLALAYQHNVRIDLILETHIHADFVSGSRALSERTGAPIAVSATDDYAFGHRRLADGDTITVGKYQLQVLSTPGHTPEHLCFLVCGGAKADAPWGLFSGDALFAGEVGRPDLLGDGTEEPLARQLYRSLHETILPLGDEIVIYPAHGEGSPCGASIGERDTSTIGYERRHNPLLAVTDEKEFVEQLLASQSPAPAYYPRMKRINAAGPPKTTTIPQIPALSGSEFMDALSDDNTVILDVRAIEAFGGAHIKGAVNIAEREPLPIWVGRLLEPEQNLLLVTPTADVVQEKVVALRRVGYEAVTGYLAGGMATWFEAALPYELLAPVDVYTLRKWLMGHDPVQLLDVRSEEEWQEGHIPQARHCFLPELPAQIDTFVPTNPVVTYCASGYRASMAASLLQRHGFEEVYTVPGSMRAWQAAGFEQA